MGNILSLFWRNRKIIILGPPNSGKTKMFYRLAKFYKGDSKIIHQKYFNYLKINNWNIWDLSLGNDPCLQYYLDNTSAIVYVYNTMMESTSKEILRYLCFTKELRNTPFLILITKAESRHEINNIINISRRMLKKRVATFIRIKSEPESVNIKQINEWINKNV